MPLVLPRGAGTCETNVRFVDQSRRLQRLPRSFPTHEARGEPAELVVNERSESIEVLRPLWHLDILTKNVVVILMGVAGSGKTVVGRALAAETGWHFEDADDQHSSGSVEKMRRGIALTDADRAPWLEKLHRDIARATDRREHLVVACSALRLRYRDALRGALPRIRFVHLAADEGTLRGRLEKRRGHYAGPALLTSQIASLEPPAATDALIVDATLPVNEIVKRIRREFGI
jgi:gluconokinase